MSGASGGRQRLRRKAEKILTRTAAAHADDTRAEDAIHELQVHQVELDLQIEELRRAEAELQSMRDRYLELYDAAPVGYLALDRTNLIAQANTAAARLLGSSKGYLRNRRFSAFLTKSSQSTFLQVSSEARRSRTPRTIDVQMPGDGGAEAWVKLDIVAEPRTGELRVTMTDITELRTAGRDLRHLAEGLIRLQEKERQAVAETLHDDMGQQLTYLTILLDRPRDGDSLDAERVGELREVAGKILQGIRALSSSLSPAELSRVGLPEALKGMVSEFTLRTRVPVSFQPSGGFEGLPFEISLAIYRIVQESLTNAARHAQPNAIILTVRRDSTRIFVEVRDDGKGFDVETTRMSVGLLAMRERARSVGGTLQVTSSPGRGTRVVFELRDGRQ